MIVEEEKDAPVRRMPSLSKATAGILKKPTDYSKRQNSWTTGPKIKFTLEKLEARSSMSRTAKLNLVIQQK
jgi:hypothetical protein